MNELAKLRDIHLPAPLTLWPVAPGWLILYLTAVISLLCVGYRWYAKYRRQAVIRYALKKLENLQIIIKDNPEKINIAAEISTLLRRTALYYFRRENIASLTGQQWLDFLNRSGKVTLFTPEIGYLLTDTPYQKVTEIDLQPLFIVTRRWLVSIAKKLQKVEG